MSTIGSVTVAAARYPAHRSRSPASATGELGTLKSQLNAWVNCPSCKTSAGKAKIAQISGKIAAITAQAQRPDVNDRPVSGIAELSESSACYAQQFRSDTVGTMLNVQA